MRKGHEIGKMQFNKISEESPTSAGGGMNRQKQA